MSLTQRSLIKSWMGLWRTTYRSPSLNSAVSSLQSRYAQHWMCILWLLDGNTGQPGRDAECYVDGSKVHTYMQNMHTVVMLSRSRIWAQWRDAGRSCAIRTASAGVNGRCGAQGGRPLTRHQ